HGLASGAGAAAGGVPPGGRPPLRRGSVVRGDRSPDRPFPRRGPEALVAGHGAVAGGMGESGMTPEGSETELLRGDEEFCRWLAAFDERLAGGAADARPDELEAPAELRE